MSNQFGTFGRSLVRTMFSPASIRSFFSQRPGVVATYLVYGAGFSTVILTLTGLDYWLPDPRRHDFEYARACRERRTSMKADLKTLARELDSIKAKQPHTRRHDFEYARACRERRTSMEADLKTLAREIDSIKAKEPHNRLLNHDLPSADLRRNQGSDTK